MFSELSDVSADPGRSPDSHSARPTRTRRPVVLPSCHWCTYLRNEESAFERTWPPISVGSRESAKVSLVGTAQQPQRHHPADRESGPKGSDRVRTAGKGNARAGTW